MEKSSKSNEVSAADIDAFGNMLKVGDEVYYASSLYGSRGYKLRRGQVSGFTAQKVKVRSYGCNGKLMDGETCIYSDKIGKVFPNAMIPTEKIAAEFV